VENILGLDEWHCYIDSLIWIKGQLDQSTFCAFLRAGCLGIMAQTALREVATRILLAGDNPKQAKLEKSASKSLPIRGPAIAANGAIQFQTEIESSFSA
jgi:hypothetical protein